MVSVITSVTLGYNNTTSKKVTPRYCNFDRYFYPEYYNCYNIDEIPDFIEQPNIDTSTDYNSSDSIVSNQKEIAQPLNGLMDSPWPMYCHDAQHTGRSPFSTANNSGILKWQYKCGWSVKGSSAIDNNGVVYFGSLDGNFYSLYKNGTLKWKYNIKKGMECGPAIDEEGTIYFGTRYSTSGNYLYAIKPNGTLKWKYPTEDVYSSPTIANDGTIIFADSENWRINALYPNGTLKWSFQTNYVVYSSPAIDDDSTVYCGSHDGNLYALYLNNGTLKWKYQTGDWVGRGPSIADDGTIYFGSWDGYLYAVYPDGTLKWKTGGHLAGTTPVTAHDGTIYVGNRYLSAIYPTNGSIRWMFDPGSDSLITGGNPCISADGTIYFGTSDGGEIFAVNANGTLKWRKSIGTCVFAPAIGEDGTIYVGTTGNNDGYFYAFGPLDPNAPIAPTITGQTIGKTGKEYEYFLKSTSPLGKDVYYYIDWGDGTIKDWLGPYGSGKVVEVSHTWNKKGTYVIQAQAKDINDLKSDWGKLTVKMPKDKVVNFNTILWELLERFPLLERLLLMLQV